MIKNLMDKLQTAEAKAGNGVAPQVPPVPKAKAPEIHDSIQQNTVQGNGAQPKQEPVQNFEQRLFGGSKMDDEGIIIDLGEGISLNIPIQRRMTLGDFLKVAEKVKALEMLSEEATYKKNY